MARSSRTASASWIEKRAARFCLPRSACAFTRSFARANWSVGERTRHRSRRHPSPLIPTKHFRLAPLRPLIPSTTRARRGENGSDLRYVGKPTRRPPGPHGHPAGPHHPRHGAGEPDTLPDPRTRRGEQPAARAIGPCLLHPEGRDRAALVQDRKSTRLNSSHLVISYAVFCLKKKKTSERDNTTAVQ